MNVKKLLRSRANIPLLVQTLGLGAASHRPIPYCQLLIETSHRLAPSLRPEGLDRVEAGGPERRINAEEEPDHDRHAEGCRTSALLVRQPSQPLGLLTSRRDSGGRERPAGHFGRALQFLNTGPKCL